MKKLYMYVTHRDDYKCANEIDIYKIKPAVHIKGSCTPYHGKNIDVIQLDEDDTYFVTLTDKQLSEFNDELLGQAVESLRSIYPDTIITTKLSEVYQTWVDGTHVHLESITDVERKFEHIEAIVKSKTSEELSISGLETPGDGWK